MLVRVSVFLLMLLLRATSAHAEYKNCLSLGQVTSLVFASEAYLNYLETGKGPRAATTMDQLLAKTSTVSLRRSLDKAGFNSISLATEEVIVLQRALVELEKRANREKAAKTAARAQAREKLSSYRKKVARLGCLDALDGNRDGTGAAEDSVEVSQEAVQLFGFVVMAALIGAVIYIRKARIRQRRAKRRPCHLSCSLFLSNRMHEALIVDVSQLGAKVKTEADCRKGDIVSLKIFGKSVVSRIMWENPHFVGITYQEPLSSSFLSEALKKSRSKPSGFPAWPSTEPA